VGIHPGVVTDSPSRGEMHGAARSGGHMSLDVGIANVKRVERFTIGSESIFSVGYHITVVTGQRRKVHAVGAVKRVAGVETVNRDIVTAQINWSLGDHCGAVRAASRSVHLDAPLDIGIGGPSGTYGPEDHSKSGGGRQWRAHISGGNNYRRIDWLDGDVVISAIGADGPYLVITPVQSPGP